MSEALAGQIGIEGIFYASLAFPAVVALYWPWWRSQLGWSITAKSLALAIAILPAMSYYWFGGRAPSWLVDLSLAGLWCVPVILAWRVLVLWRVQRQGVHPDSTERLLTQGWQPPGSTQARVAELEQENAWLRQRLAETTGGST